MWKSFSVPRATSGGSITERNSRNNHLNIVEVYVEAGENIPDYIRPWVRPGQEKKEIYEVIKKTGTMSLQEIWAATGKNPNTIRGAVVSLTNAGLIERVEKGVYQPKSK